MKHSCSNESLEIRPCPGINPPGLLQLVIFAILTLVCLLFTASIFSPRLASANPGKTTTCLNCHNAENTGASIFVAVEGAEWNTASNYVLSSYTGSSLDVEIDYVFKNNTEAAGGETVAMMVSTPSGWPITPGTVNSPTGTNFGANWSSAWDIATSNLSTTETYYTVSTGDTTYYPNSPDNYSIYWNDITGSGWNAGKNKGAFDDASAGDLDGMAETMGTDFRITVPAGLTAGTTHQIVVLGIGHLGSSKSYVHTTLTLEIPSGGDTEEPTSAITDPTNGADLNSSAADPYSIIGTASDNDAVSLVEVSINGGAWLAATDTGGGTPWSTWSYSWTLPADGPYTIQSRATDASSNQEGAGAGNAGISVTVDRTAPTFGGVTSATDAGTGGAVDLTWTAATDANPPITYNIYWSTTSGGQNFTTPDSTSTNASGDTVSGLIDDQIYYFIVRAEDSGGNEELNNTELSTTPTTGGGDAIEPTSAITDPANSATLNSSAADPYTITGTASDNDAVSLVEVSINGGAWLAATDTGGGTWSTWSYSWTLPADGPYTIQSRATDASSNQEGAGAGNAGISVTVDRTAPTFGGVTSATDAETGGAVDLTWTAATDANLPITYNIYWSTTSGGQNFTTPDATSANATGDTVSGLIDDQIYYFVVRAEDSGGNEELNSTELSATPTAPVPCVYATPTVTISTADKDITTDGWFVKYRIRVTNNDSATCSPTSLNLTLSDSNATNFYPSLSDINPLNVSPLSSAETTIQVTAKANQTDGATNDTFFYTEADGNHAQSANSNSVTTTISVTGAGCLTDGSFLNANGDQLIISR